jgi:hypothetical protein
MADLVLLSPSAVAAKHGIKRATIYKWLERDKPLIGAHDTALSNIVELKKARIGALAMEYLEANFNAQIAQAYVTSDPNYINRQPAGELAILHGVLADKSIRLLEALHGRQDTPAERDGE